MLRARATDIGPWEQYSLGDLGNGRFALFSLANNLIVSAEFGYGGGDNGMLRARAAAVGPWEQFYLYSIGTYWAFQSYYPLNSPCCYVSTELGYTGIEQNLLRARATEVGAWELYNLYNLTSYP